MFADVAVQKWSQPANDPPDIECYLFDGSKVGLELTSWLDKDQISRAKQAEKIEEPFRRFLRFEPNNTENFYFVVISTKKRLQKVDESKFRLDLLALISELDKRWNKEPDWQSPQGFSWSDFKGYPILEKYVEGLDIQPRMPSRPSTENKGRPGWLQFPLRGG
jgi:hypothetical protein